MDPTGMRERSGQTLCLKHNRWYVDGYACPDCERDEALERQTDYLEQIASVTSDGNQPPAEVTHTHSHQHTFRGVGVVAHVNVNYQPPDPDKTLQMVLEAAMVFISAFQAEGEFRTLEEWANLIQGGGTTPQLVTAAILRGLATDMLLERKEGPDRIVIMINVNSEDLATILPAPREEYEFLRDLSARLAAAHGITPPSFEDDEDDEAPE